MKVLGLGGLAFVLALGACGIPREKTAWTEPGPELFQTGPYLILGATGEAFVSLKAELSEPPVVQWWVETSGEIAAAGESATLPADGRVVQEVTAEKDDDLWTATLRNLPATAYVSYRVESVKGDTDIYKFRTGVPDGEPFRFASFGDTRDGHGVHRAIVEAVAREHVDFVLNTGDMVAQGGVRKQWDRFFQIERPLIHDTPILPAIGNHDAGNGHYFRHYFQHDRWTGGRRYYAHDWGKLRVVAVDSGIECRDGCAQYAFAEKALRDGAARGMLMVMFLHHPPYSSGSHGSDDTVQRPIKDLAKRHGVELVVSGHDHNYERSKSIDGTTYIVSGSAGAPIRRVQPRSWSAHARTEPHYVLFDIQDEVIAIRAVNLEGNVFDTAVVFPLAPAIR